MNAYEYFQLGISDEEKKMINDLIAKRTEAKKVKDFATADKIREEISKMDIQLIDTPEKTFWEKV